MNKTQSILLILTGPPGSGKTHIAEQFSKANGYTHINSDSVRANYFPNPDFSLEERERVYAKIHEVITLALTNGENVLFDGNLLTNADRLAALKRYTSLGARVLFVFLDVPRQKAIRQALLRQTSDDGLYNAMPKERAYRMHEIFEKPSSSLPQVVVKNTDNFSGVNRTILNSLKR